MCIRDSNGYASLDPDAREGTLTPMFETIVSHVPPPEVNKDAPFQFLVTLLDRDNFLGRVLKMCIRDRCSGVRASTVQIRMIMRTHCPIFSTTIWHRRISVRGRLIAVM